MDSSARPGKPYTVYGGEGGAPRGPAGPARRSGGRLQRTRRRRRGILVAIVAAAVLLAGTATALAVLWPTGGGGGQVAGAQTPAASASPTASPNTGDANPSGSSSPAASPSPSAPSGPATVSVTAGGDVIGGFGVSGVVDSLGDALFKSIAPWFEKSDHGFVNLESPLTTGGEPQGWKDVVIKGNPDLAPALAASGIDVVTMANNHAGDMGDSGLLDSIRHARKHGIAVVGAGKDLDAAMAGTLLESENGATTAFLGFTDVLPIGYPATPSSPGVGPGRADLGAVKRAIKAADKKADYVIVGWHWNFEYKRAPSALESSEGKAAIDAGADVVFAHHPHLLNGVEAYHGGLICYSLGNLVFSGFSGETAETVLVRVKVSPDRLDAQLIPVRIDGSGVPAVATGVAADSILERVRALSADLGTTVKISRGKGYVHIRR